jgi:hypothetical protein
MKTGTKSLLFGVHQFLWHPVTVWLAWRDLYGTRPTWRETVCIIVHDWGYWGCEEMDGRSGLFHPYRGAAIADAIFGWEYASLVMWHSRTLAKRFHRNPSKLCWPDKVSMKYDPTAFYLFRARLSGELKEYRKNAAESDFCPANAPDKVWHRKLVAHLAKMAEEKKKEFTHALS